MRRNRLKTSHFDYLSGKLVDFLEIFQQYSCKVAKFI
jgi:hypothetical protein